MFKKSKRNFRKKADTESSESGNGSNDDEEAMPTSSSTSNRNAAVSTSVAKKPETAKSLSSRPTPVLSFDDLNLLEHAEEENGEEFRVKKSKESRRIAKELKRFKKEKERIRKYGPSGTKNGKSDEQIEKPKLSLESNDTESNNDDLMFNFGIKLKPLNIVNKSTSRSQKYLTNKYGSENGDKESDNEKASISSDSDDEVTKLQKLREEMAMLNGEELDPIETESDETKRSMKIMLRNGIIPDASLIHAARKKREMARLDDFVPISGAKPKNNNSTLIREEDEDDEHDYSDDGTSSRNRVLQMNYKEIEEREMRTNRDNFLAYEQGSDDDERYEKRHTKRRRNSTTDQTNENSDNDAYNGGHKANDTSENDDDDDEMSRWEAEQIRKGVQMNQAQNYSYLGLEKSSKFIGDNYGSADTISDEKKIDAEKLNNLPKITFSSIINSLKQTLVIAEESLHRNENELNKINQNLEANRIDNETLQRQRPVLNDQYIFFQEMKSFLRDYVDCHNSKLAEFIEAEENLLQQWKQQTEKRVQQRLNAVKDQNIECSIVTLTSNQVKIVDQAHQKRFDEREAKKSRKKKRNTSSTRATYLNDYYYSSDSQSDNEETVSRKKIADEASAKLKSNLFSDVMEDFYEIELVKNRFEKWNQLSAETFRNAYIPLSLPLIFTPLVRYELFEWNPLLEHTNDPTIANQTWFRQLITFNRERCINKLEKTKAETTRYDENDETMLVPFLVDKVVLKRLIDLADNVYDAMSLRQTTRFTRLLTHLIKYYPTLNANSKNLKKLLESILKRIRFAIDRDLYLPLYSKQIIENEASPSSQFFHQQFWSSVKLFGNILKWRGILSEKLIKELTLDSILNRYIFMGLQFMQVDMKVVEKIEFVVKLMPSDWLSANEESKMTTPQLANLLKFLARIAEPIAQSSSSSQVKTRLEKIKSLLISMGSTDLASQVRVK